MKKLLIATLCATAFTLTACDKKAADPATAPAAVISLSSNNVADIKSDLDAIDALAIAKSDQALASQDKMMEADQKKDKVMMSEAMQGMKAYIKDFNQELLALKLKSTEVDALRNKMDQQNKVTLEISDLSMSGSQDQSKMEMLGQSGIKLSEEIAKERKALAAKVAEKK
ncbi:hypothetical protein EC844_12312 [Acinetobacter calcoaceticus]|uniref:Lipoprotein n=1 Tax=Acinetobacter calcoaceticus TaxID=471 RepID=A0A4V2R000_ACICA|nr:hypothetical protein EC844_12312 [Acinetobacter calcoaceticus]